MRLRVTPTAGYQFDVSSVHEPSLVAGLTANGDLLGFVEDHLTPHLASFTGLIVAHVGVNAQLLWLWHQRFPQCRLVATPTVWTGREISILTSSYSSLV